MAKRTPQSEANETPSPAQAKNARTRSRAAGRGSAGQVRAAAPASAPAETFAARAEPSDGQAPDLGAAATRSQSLGSEPSEEEIRVRAYHRYLERGGENGLDFDDWLEAERELKQLSGNW